MISFIFTSFFLFYFFSTAFTSVVAVVVDIVHECGTWAQKDVMQCRWIHTYVHKVTISTRVRNENVMKYVNWICYSYNNKNAIKLKSSHRSKRSNFDSNKEIKWGEREGEKESDGKMNMVTEMICDSIFEIHFFFCEFTVFCLATLCVCVYDFRLKCVVSR